MNKNQTALPWLRLLLLFLIAFQASSSFAWEGRVVLKGPATPVAGAEVSVLGSNVVQRTDETGRFEFAGVAHPPFEILVVLQGGRYLTPILVSSLPESGALTIEVEPTATETVTVTGAAPGIDAAPVSGTTLVPRADMELRQPDHLMEALENVAGVSQVSEGHAAVPAVRGLARGRTLILIDGARVSSERRVGPSATYLDPFVLDSVEVARGPGSVAYGSDAFGGVISARTHTFEPGGPLSVGVTGTIAGSGEPGERVGAELSGGLGEKAGFLVAGHYRSYDDWESPQGDVFNSEWEDYGALVKVGSRIGKGLLTFGWQGDYARDVGRPRNNSQTVRFYYPEEDSSRFTLGYDLGPVWGFSNVGITALFGTYDQITDQDRFNDDPRTIERADVSAKDYQLRGVAERLFGSNMRLAVGVDVTGRFDLHALDIGVEYVAGVPVESINVSVDDARRMDAGLFATFDAQVAEHVSLSLGARGDSVETKNTGGFFGDLSTSNSDFSGLAAITVGSFGGFSATAQVARGFRDPVLSDRYFRGPSGQGFITGNPDLEPETSNQYDLALRYTIARARFAVYAYEYRIEDLIERYEETDDNFFFRNRGEARLRGVELEAQLDLPRRWSLAFAGQVERGITLDDELPIDDIPARSISLQARKDFTRWFGSVRVAGIEHDDNPGPNEIETPGYCLIDAGVGFHVAKWLDLQAYGRNLLDQEFYSSPDARFVLAPGISGTLTALVRF